MKLTRSLHQIPLQTWLVLGIALFFIFTHVRLSQYAFDDAYIHFRAARNLLDTGMPYFNAQEAVKVSSSSGWTLFLAVLLILARLMSMEAEFPLIVGLVNSLISLTAMLIFTKVVEKLLTHPLTKSGKFFLQVSLLGMLAVSSIGLMETSLAMLLSGIGIYNLIKSRPAGFVWLGIAAYFRLELIVTVVILGILFAVNARFPSWKIILLTGSGLLPFLLYDLYFFQTIVPHSIIAKSMVYSITGLHTFTRLVLLSVPLGLLNNQLLSFSIGLILLISAVVCIAIAAIRGRNSNRNIWIGVFGLWALLIGAAYISRHILLFEWYLPLYTIPMFIAITLCAEQQGGHLARIPSLIQSAFVTIYLFSLGQTAYASVMDPGLYDQFEAGSRVKSYLEVGRTLNSAYPDSTLLSSEIGGLGYTFQGHVLDAAGLASPDALEFHPMNVPEERTSGDLGSIPTRYVEKTMPDLIVSYDHFAEALLTSEIVEQYDTILIPAYLQQDIPYARKPTIWGDAFLRIYVRKGLQVSEELKNLGN